MRPTILIVEDDVEVKEFLEEILRDELYSVFSTESGTKGLQLIDKLQPNLVILDLNLPDVNGLSICQEIKKYNPTLPILVLTASTETKDLVGSFGKGADDFLTKPFINEELLARVKARLNQNSNGETVIQIGDLTIDTNAVEVHRNNKSISLTQTEFELLHYLMANANRVLSREQILSHVWSQDPDIETRVVDVYIGYLRKKIGDKKDNKLIHSKRGFGYVLKTTK